MAHPKTTTLHLVMLLTMAGLGACSRGGYNSQGHQAAGSTNNSTGIIQTHFPGQVTAGGGTSGAQMAAHPETAASGQYHGGTPGIAGGAGGNTGGAATGGTVRESGQGPSPQPATPTGAGGA